MGTYKTINPDGSYTSHTFTEFGSVNNVGDDLLVKPATAGLVDDDAGKTITNEGAAAKAIFTLPPAVAGLKYRFIVQDADGIRVTANTGDTIRNAASVSGAAGYIENTTIGSVVDVECLNATQWFVTNLIGTWTPV